MEYKISIIVHGKCEHYDSAIAKQQLNLALDEAFDALSANVMGHFYKEEKKIDIVDGTWMREWLNP